MLARLLRAGWLVTAIVVFVACAAAPAWAQMTTAGKMPLPPDQAFNLSATRHGDDGVTLHWTIAPGYYLYKDKFAVEQGATDRPITDLQGVAVTKDDPTFGVSTIYHDQVTADVPVSGSPGGPLEIRYQGCQSEGICYPPLVRTVNSATLAVTDPQDHHPARQVTEQSASAAPASGITIAVDRGGMIGSLLSSGGVVTVLVSFMLFGILLAFTPCVFPMYPILAGAIARQGDSVTMLRSFTLSLAYVLAMASAFGLLGVAAAWSGQNLQMALQSPLAVGAVSALFVVLALSMFGLFELQLPSAWVVGIGRLGGAKHGSLASAALLGFTSALIVGPCVTAPLAGALIYIAQTGDVALGAASLFALGLGKGVPLIVFGTLGPKALPRAGTWMITVREAFGFVFMATAIWMGSRLLPASMGLALWALFAIGLAVWLGAFDTLSPDATGRRRTGKAIGLAAALYGAMLAVGAASGASDPLSPLETLAGQRGGSAVATLGPAFQSAATPAELRSFIAEANGRPSLLYVTADWCVTCSVIDRNVLSNAGVQSALAPLNLIKLDVSGDTPAQQEMMRNLQVVGPPTMIFVGQGGQEAPGTRLVGDVTRESLQTSIAKTESAR